MSGSDLLSLCRDDLVQVGVGPGNHTLTVRTVNVGLTLLAVWDSENMGVADYVPLPVGHAIYPQEADRLLVGDVVCFVAQLTNTDGEQPVLWGQCLQTGPCITDVCGLCRFCWYLELLCKHRSSGGP